MAKTFNRVANIYKYIHHVYFKRDYKKQIGN